MTAPMLSELAALRVTVSRTPEGRLHVDAPRGAMTPALLERLRLHREELLAALAQEGDPAPPASTPPPRPGSEVLPQVVVPQAPPPPPASLAPATSDPDADPDVGAQVLEALAEADVRITLFEDGSLGWDAPPDYVNARLAAAITEAAPEIRAELHRRGVRPVPRWICLAELDPARFAPPSTLPPTSPSSPATPSTPHRRAAAANPRSARRSP